MRWIRRRVAWIAGAAVGGFLLWFVGLVGSIHTLQADSAGTLFGRRVPVSDYLSSLQAVTRQAILTHGDRASKEVPQQELERRAWERLMLLTEAKRQRIRIPDQEVVAELQSWPIFQTKGRFDPQGYEAILTYNLGVTPRLFEEEIRQMLMIEKLLEKVPGELRVTEEELKASFRKREESIKVSVLTFPQEQKALAQEVADILRQNPKEFPRIAKKLNVKPTTTDFFKWSSSILELGVAGTTFGPAFSLQPNEVTGPIFSPRGWLVVKLEARQPADEKNFPHIRQELERGLLAQKRLRTTFAWYQELLTRANLKKTVSGEKPKQ